MNKTKLAAAELGLDRAMTTYQVLQERIRNGQAHVKAYPDDQAAQRLLAELNDQAASAIQVFEARLAEYKMIADRESEP